MGTGDSYATPGDLRKFMGSAAESLTDDEAQFFLDGASAAITDFTGIDLWAVAGGTIQTYAYGGESLLLPVVNLTAVTSVTVLATTNDVDPVLVDPNRYRPDRRLNRIELVEGYTWSYGRKVLVETVCDYGFVDMPLGVVATACVVASRATSNPRGVQSESVGGVSVRYAAAAKGGATATGFILSTADEDMLARYCIRSDV